MLVVDRIQQWITLVLVIGSATLLAIAQQNSQLAIMASAAAIVAFVVNDWWGLVRFNRWFANAAAIGVTAWTLRNFLQSDSTSQLLMIANLLVYLQVVLLFQRKTPRVYWQILVLSLLQVVVAAAFNISFEGGIVFFAYLLFSSIMMLVLQVHTQTSLIKNANLKNAEMAMRVADDRSAGKGPVVLAMHDQINPDRRPLRLMVRQVCGLGIVALGFASVAFFLMPRDQQAWTGAPLIQYQVAGMSRSVNLEEMNDIYLSEQPVFTAKFYPRAANIELATEPYFCGMPLPNLVVQNDQTRWEAPYDRVYGGRTMPRIARYANSIRQVIELEPTNDPLLFTVQPAAITSRTPSEVQWSSQLGLYSRSNEFGLMGAESFEYEFRVAMRDTRRREPFEAVPYIGINAPTTVPLDQNPGEYKWLTSFPAERYPQLVKTAQDVSRLVPDPANHYLLASALCNYLAIEGGFTYTLNFSQIRWTSGIDHIEDFLVNQKRGHCEFFASALVLMLRSQGIPARIMVGYRGGDFQDEDNSYNVKQKHAHAWVEAYIRPRDCPRQWTVTGETSGLGSWLRLDPTPGTDDEEPVPVNASALNLAKNFWTTYVMGLDSKKQSESLLVSLLKNPFRGWGEFFTVGYWEGQWRIFTDPRIWYRSMVFKAMLLAGFLILLVAAQQWWSRRRRAAGKQAGVIKPRLQKWLGRAIGFVAPRWGRWVAGEIPAAREVPFYQRLQRLLQRYEIVRLPHQTAREFSQSAVAQLHALPDAIDFRRHLENLVDCFYRVRFRSDTLSDEEMKSVESSLDTLDAHLRAGATIGSHSPT
jgi:hypothetical protein